MSLLERPGGRRWMVGGALLIHCMYLASWVAQLLAPTTPHILASRLFRDSAWTIGPGCDFYQFYQAGEDILAGREFFRDKPTPGVESSVPYAYPWVRYPPLLGYTLGLASNLVEPVAAYALWCVFLEACLLASVVALRRRFPEPADRALIACAYFGWSLFYLDLYMGQTSYVLGTMILMLALAHEQGRWRAEAAWYCASVLFKYQTLCFGLFYLLRRRFKLLALAGALLFLFNAPYFLHAPASWEVFLRWTVRFKDNAQLAFVGNFGFPAFLAHLTGNYSFSLYHAASLAALLLSVGRTLADWRALDPARAFLLWLATIFFAQLASYEHNYNVLLSMLVLCVLRSRERPLLWSLILLALPTPFVWMAWLFPASTGRFGALFLISFRVVPLLVIYATLLVRGLAPRPVVGSSPAREWT